MSSPDRESNSVSVRLKDLAEFCGCTVESIRAAAAGFGIVERSNYRGSMLLCFVALVMRELRISEERIAGYLEVQHYPPQVSTIDPKAVPNEHGRNLELGFRMPKDDPEYVVFTSHYFDLLSPQEKAQYYQDMLSNGGREDVKKVIADCERRIATKQRQLDCGIGFTLSEQRSLKRDILALKDCIYYRTPESVEEDDEENTATYAPSMPTRRLEALVAFWSAFDSTNLEHDLLIGESPLLDVTCAEIQSATTEYAPFESLLAHAERGNVHAALLAAKKVENQVEKLTLLAKLHPETFGAAARHMARWPILFSKHSKLADNSPPFPHKIGEALFANVNHYPRWDPNDHYTVVAQALLTHVSQIKRNPARVADMPYAQIMKELPEITQPGASDKWWEAAKSVFLTAYPEPETIESLNCAVLGSNRKHQSLIRQKIIERLRNRFDSLIGKKSHDKRLAYKKKR